MKNLSFAVSLLTVLAAFAALLWAPAEAIEGARQGLRICAGTIIPSLLPFLILSALLTGLGLPRLLARYAGGLFRRVFGVSGGAAAPFLLGLTGGYPMGAASLAALVRRGEMDAEEAGRALAFCNNTGPAFIVGAAGSGVFGSAGLGLLLYAAHILAAVCTGLLCSLGRPRRERERKPEAFPAARALPALLPESVKSTVTALLNICGFVVFFSVITALLDALGSFAAAAGRLAAGLGLELRFTRALLTGLLELGGGIAAMSGLEPSPLNLSLCAFLLGFGSLSVHCQTLAAAEDAGLAFSRHFFGKLLHGLLSAGITFLLAKCLIFL